MVKANLVEHDKGRFSRRHAHVLFVSEEASCRRQARGFEHGTWTWAASVHALRVRMMCAASMRQQTSKTTWCSAEKSDCIDSFIDSILIFLVCAHQPINYNAISLYLFVSFQSDSTIMHPCSHKWLFKYFISRPVSHWSKKTLDANRYNPCPAIHESSWYSNRSICCGDY